MNIDTAIAPKHAPSIAAGISQYQAIIDNPSTFTIYQ
jgi:hypothetical protein